MDVVANIAQKGIYRSLLDATVTNNDIVSYAKLDADNTIHVMTTIDKELADLKDELIFGSIEEDVYNRAINVLKPLRTVIENTTRGVGGLTKELTLLQQKFVDEYITTNDAIESLKAAYKSVGTIKEDYVIRKEVNDLLSNKDVSDEIISIKEARRLNARITKERILHEMSDIAFQDPRNLFGTNNELLDISKMTRGQVASIKKIKVVESARSRTTEIELVNKLEALQALDKHSGLYDESPIATQGKADNTVNIVFNDFSDSNNQILQQ